MRRKTNLPLMTTAVFMTTFMTAIEGTIVSTAMPTIVSDLNGLELMNWVVSAFLFMTAVSTPIYGKLADSVGRKPIFLFGILVFVVGSALCGLSQNMYQLIFFRVIQGLGSGAIQPLAITLIADLYPIEKRAKMLGFNSSFWGVASVMAPLLGGFIVQHLSWHWIFYINVPIGLVAMGLVQFFFVEHRQKRTSQLDYKGTLLLVTLLLSLMLFLQAFGEHASALLLVLLAGIFIASSLGFIGVERRAADPILMIHMFKNREFVSQNLITLLISGVVIGFEFYIPTWMQGINGTSASLAGFSVTPSSIMWIAGSFVAGTLMSRLGVKSLFDRALGGLLLADLALLWIPMYTPFWAFCLIAAVNGAAFGTIITVSTVRTQVLVSEKEVGVATSFNTLMRYLGQTMMVSVYGIVFNLIISNQLTQSSHLTQDMMNKIVSSAKTQQLPLSLIPALRLVLHRALHGVYVVSLLAILLSLAINQIYQRHQKN